MRSILEEETAIEFQHVNVKLYFNNSDADLDPFPFGHRERLKGTCWSLMLCLDTATNIALSNEFGDFPLHTGPPKALAKILVHFGCTGMDGERGVMGFLKNQDSQLFILGYDKTVTKP